MSGCSFVVLPSAKVVELCERKIAWIKARREEFAESWILRAMAERTKSVGWFKPPRPVSREEAVAIGEKPYWDGSSLSALGNCRTWCSNAEDRCRSLLLAAAHATEVHVSIEDLEAIS